MSSQTTEFQRGIDAAIALVRAFKRDFDRPWREQLIAELTALKEVPHAN